MQIAVGSDDIGFALKETIEHHLIELCHDVIDFGSQHGEPVDYPDVAIEVARAVAAHRFDRAILVCGTGIGMAITANKVPGVRAASVADPYSAERARKSSDAQGALPRGRWWWAPSWRKSSSITGWRPSSSGESRPERLRRLRPSRRHACRRTKPHRDTANR